MNLIKICTAFGLFVLGATINAAPFISGNLGLNGTVASDPSSSSYDPTFALDGYLSGQLNFSSNLILNADISINTSDVSSSGLFGDKIATFRMDSLSATYILPAYGKIHSLNVFTGRVHAIGKEEFLQQQFGIKPFYSLMTDDWFGVNGVNIQRIYGNGFSYTIKPASLPIALAFLAYKNKDNEDDTEPTLDLKFGTVTKYFSAELMMGAGIPFKSEDPSGNKVFLYIDSINLHSAADILIGSSYGSSLLIQFGFENMIVKAASIDEFPSADDIFILTELRMREDGTQVCMGVFNIPGEKSTDETTGDTIYAVSNMPFIEDTFGANLTIMNDRLHFFDYDMTFGVHGTFSVPNMHFTDIPNFNDYKSDANFKVSPFMDVKIFGGVVKVLGQINVLDLQDDKGKAIKFSVGYKTSF